MLKLHGYFKDGAVLQRGAPINIKGHSDNPVECTLKGGSYLASARSDCADGRFSLTLPACDDYSKPYVLCVKNGTSCIEFNIKLGDVYITAGQSNMSYALGSTENGGEWADRACKADIAVLSLSEPPFTDTSELLRPVHPQEDFVREYDWTLGKDGFLTTSAISVQVATLLNEKSGVPVGTVHTSMGGLSVESYLKRDSMLEDGELLEFSKNTGRYQEESDYNNAGVRNFTQVSGIWNEKISPLAGFSFKGFIWYLGESSAWDHPTAKMFERCMNLIIRDVKRLFNGIPFVCVHIAPEYYHYGDGYGYLYVNEAISNLQNEEQGVYSIPVYDVEPRWLIPDGELYFHPIHPVNKCPISHRIANLLTDFKIFPEIYAVEKRGKKLVARVRGGELIPGPAHGFTVAGESGKYYPAKACVTDGQTVEVYSDEVPAPTRLTYAFMQYQDFCNVRDVSGRPLVPYRTVQEPVNGGYFFTPAYMTEGAEAVYENCFGTQAGTCRLHRVWSKGTIYDASEVSISFDKGGLSVSSAPDGDKFFMFGISPAICMSGHKHHLGDFDYINFNVSSDGEAQLLGAVARLYNGETIRFDLMNGPSAVAEIPVTMQPNTVSIRLFSGLTQASAPIELKREDREKIVALELSFRAKSAVTVRIDGLTLSDENRSMRVEEQAKQQARADINLPT